MLAAETTNERPGSEEVYETATNTSNLRESAERRGATDVLRDMAMSSNRLGAALLRLRAQWESSTKPERQQPRTMQQWRAIEPDKDKAEAAYWHERQSCDDSYDRALNTLANRLADLAAVREELTPIAMKWGFGKPTDPEERSERTEKTELDDKLLQEMRAAVEAADGDAEKTAAQATLNHWMIEVQRQRAVWDAEDRIRAEHKIGAIVRYWLDQTCPKCDGLKFLVQPGTARLSKNICPRPSQGGCGGTGFLSVPFGQDGRKLANHMDQCAHRYQGRMKARRAAFNSMPTIEKLSKRSQARAKGAKYIDPEAD